MKHNLKYQSGLTLYEILVAVVIVGIGLMTWSRLQGATWGQNKSIAKIRQAGHLIENHLEAMRVGISRDMVNQWPPKDIDSTVGDMKIKRTVSAAYSPKDGKEVATVRKINIIVMWNEPHKDSIAVTTYVTRLF